MTYYPNMSDAVLDIADRNQLKAAAVTLTADGNIVNVHSAGALVESATFGAKKGGWS